MGGRKPPQGWGERGKGKCFCRAETQEKLSATRVPWGMDFILFWVKKCSLLRYCTKCLSAFVVREHRPPLLEDSTGQGQSFPNRAASRHVSAVSSPRPPPTAFGGFSKYPTWKAPAGASGAGPQPSLPLLELASQVGAPAAPDPLPSGSRVTWVSFGARENHPRMGLGPRTGLGWLPKCQ